MDDVEMVSVIMEIIPSGGFSWEWTILDVHSHSIVALKGAGLALSVIKMT